MLCNLGAGAGRGPMARRALTSCRYCLPGVGTYFYVEPSIPAGGSWAFDLQVGPGRPGEGLGRGHLPGPATRPPDGGAPPPSPLIHEMPVLFRRRAGRTPRSRSPTHGRFPLGIRTRVTHDRFSWRV